MVIVSSAFMSSRRERIRLRVSEASGRAVKTSVGTGAFGFRARDNTDGIRDQSFHCIADAESQHPVEYYPCGDDVFNRPDSRAAMLPRGSSAFPAPVRVAQRGGRQRGFQTGEKHP